MPTTNSTTFTTLSGDYHVGMKRSQAKDQKKFDKIDTNHDKVLQGHEICNERDIEIQEKRSLGTLFNGIGIVGAGAYAWSATSEGATIGSVGGPWGAALGALAGIGLAAFNIYCIYDDNEKCKDAQRETNSYREKHKFDANF